MSTHKFDLEKFNGSNDFTLWKVKMKALLVQQGCATTLEGEAKLPKDMAAERKVDILESGHRTILLSLTKEVLREVVDQTSAGGIWEKLFDKYQNNFLKRAIPEAMFVYT